MTEPRYDEPRYEDRHDARPAGDPHRDPGRRDPDRRGGSPIGWLLGLLAVIALVVAGFFLLGGDVDSDVEGGDIDVEAPSSDLDVDPPEVDVEVTPGDAEADASESD